MASVNKVILIGNLGKDSEARHTGSGVPVVSFGLATTETWKDANGQKQSKTEWHTVLYYGKTAEGLGKYLTKGKAVYIEGKIATRSWDDKDGNKRYKTEIIAKEIKLMGGADNRQQRGDDEGYRTGSADEPPQHEQSAQQPADDADLPF